MNLEEYQRRIESMHTVTGIPSYWEELQVMTAERDAALLTAQQAIADCERLRAELKAVRGE